MLMLTVQMVTTTPELHMLRPQPTIVGWGLNIIGSRDSPQDSNMKLSALLNKLVAHPTALSGGPYQASRNEPP